MEFDNRWFIILGISAIFAGARALYEGIRAFRKRYFKFRVGRRVNDQVYRGNKARRIGIPMSLIGALLLVAGFRLIAEYKTYSFVELGIVLGIVSVLAAWAIIEMSSIHR